MSSALYALAGGLFSFAVMALLKRIDCFSITAVSMTGGVCHNLAQLAVASAVVGSTKVFLYFPVLLVAGAAAGIFNGVVSALVLGKMRSTSGR